MDRSKFKFIRSERIIQSVNAHLTEEYLQAFLFEEGISTLEEVDRIDEATINKLRQNIERGFPKTTKRQHITDQVTILKKTLTPYIGSRNLLIEAQAKSITSGPNVYQPEILFDSVVFVNEDTANNVSFVATDGNTYHIETIKYNGHNARVRCTCLDFHYRFSYYNSLKGDLHGKTPSGGKRKTYPGKTPLGRLWSRIRGKVDTSQTNKSRQEMDQENKQRGLETQEQEQEKRATESFIFNEAFSYPEVNPMHVPGFCKHIIRLSEDLQRDKIITLS